MHEDPGTFYWAVVYLASSRKTKDPVGMSHALRCLGNVCATMEDEETALNLFHAALDAGSTMDIHRLRAECMVRIGDIMIRRDDSIQVKEMWMAAQPLFVRSSRMKDAASVDKRLEKLSHTQQADSHFSRAGRDGDVI
ncbi:hypothetical protein B0H13DRAFT_1884235 [Mycena leptocephala]|nr:hypothetical protein B0H13DRAFT_1884235 [Mycena leptocephala]